MRRRWLSVCACALMASLALAVPLAPAAIAAGLNEGAVSQLTEGGGEEETSATSTAASTKTASSSSSSTSSTVLIVVVGAAVVLLSGVAFVIMRDARRVPPATDVEFAQGSVSRHSEAAMRRRRAKAKAARKQRKRNR